MADAGGTTKELEQERPAAATARAPVADTTGTAGRSAARDLTAALDRPPAGSRPAPPAALMPSLILGLQRASGNAAVVEFLRQMAPAEPLPRSRGRVGEGAARAKAVPEEAAAPPPAVETAPAPASNGAVATADVPQAESETESEAQPPPPGTTDGELERLDASIREAHPEPEPAAEPVEARDAEPVGEAPLSAATAPSAEAPAPIDEAPEVEAEPAGEPAVPVDESEVKASAGADLDAVGASGGDDEAAAAAAGGGGGESAALPERADAPAPDLSQHEPAQAMAAAASLPPAKLLTTLSSVDAAGSRTVSEEQAEFTRNPPKRTPSLPSPAERPSSEQHSLPLVGRVGEGVPKAPASDGNAGPEAQQVHEHRAALQTSIRDAQLSGAREAATPMGEDAIAPGEPMTEMQAEVPAAESTGGAPGTSAAAATAQPEGPEDEAASIVAQEEKGAEIRAGATDASAAMATSRQEHDAKVQQERGAADQQMQQAEQQHAAELSSERSKAKADVQQQRAQWTDQQKQAADSAHGEANDVMDQATSNIASERAAAREQAAEAQRKADAEAAEEKKKSQGSGGILGAIGSAVTSVVDTIKAGVSAIYEKAKALVSSIVEKARAAIGAVVSATVSALGSIGTRLVSAFSAMRERFTSAIKALVAAAKAAADRIARALKESIKATLNFYANAFRAAGRLLARAYNAAVEKVKAVVKGAIDFVKSAIAAFGQFVALIKDIAAGPVQWLKNLGAAIVDGIKNHLWKAIKTAVSTWFNDKVEEVLGLGRAVWNLLTKGGISLAKVGQMAWEAIKAAIPGVLIGLLIEKLVSMIVPAAGAILMIIQGLQAAWGTIKRILAALEKFFAFLKRVKFGDAGPLFAEAVAAGAIAAIDFVANWLLKRLRKPASAVAGRIRAIAQKIGEKLKLVAKAIGRGLKRVGSAIARTGVGRAVRRAFAAVGRGARRIKEKFNAWRERRRARHQQSAQERLERAVLELGPKIQALAARGVTGLKLRAQLLWWRIRYRLTALTLDRGAGERVTVTARVNPSASVAQGYMPRGEHLRLMIARVAKRILAREDVSAGGEAMSREREALVGRGLTKEGTGIEALNTPDRGFPALTSHLRSQTGARAPKPFESRYYYLGAERQRVSETRMWGSHPMDLFVAKGGAYTPRAGGTSVVEELRAIQLPKTMSDQDIAVVVRDFARTGQMPEGMAAGDKATLARFTFLFFGRESARHPSNLAYAPMTVDLVGQGAVTWGEALNDPGLAGGGGMSPMTMKGAPWAAEDLSTGVPKGVKDPQKRWANALEMRRREIEMAEAWLRVQIAASDHVLFTDDASAEEWLYNHLLRFYRLKAPTELAAVS